MFGENGFGSQPGTSSEDFVFHVKEIVMKYMGTTIAIKCSKCLVLIHVQNQRFVVWISRTSRSAGQGDCARINDLE